MSAVDPVARGDGGLAARRAIVRWAWRLFRREWRRQAVVLVLLTVAVAFAVGGGSVAYNAAGVSDAAEFGDANHVIRFPVRGPRDVTTAVDAARRTFGDVDPVAIWPAAIPGSVDQFEFRALNPDGAFSAPLVALVEGRYPRADHEVALTDGVATAFEVAVGSTLSDSGRARIVVGVVENPNDLSDEFALVAPNSIGEAERVSLLLDTTTDSIRSFLGSGVLPDHGVVVGSAARNAGPFAAITVLVVAQLALLLVALVSAAGFVIVAQRRLRQMGMLGAIGATERHLRLVVATNGALIGLTAASLGTVVGLAGWILTAPRIEGTIGSRIDVGNVPWWLVVTTVTLAVATATAAARWPAKAMARVPLTVALTGRPPTARPAPVLVARALVLAVAGVVCLAMAGDVADEFAIHWWNVALVLAGVLSTAIGVLLLSPVAVRALATGARRMPVASRLALRDLGRHQARSGAALAAVTLTLGIACIVVIASAAAEPAPGEGNLSADELLLRSGDRDSPLVEERTRAESRELATGARAVADALDATTVLPLDVVFDPDVAPGPDGQQVLTLARRTGGQFVDVAVVHLATPELLDESGVDPASLIQGADLVTSETGEIRLLGDLDDDGRHRPQPVGRVTGIPAAFTSHPTTFVTSDTVRQRGWATTRVGWLISMGSQLSVEQVDVARHLAADANLTIETRSDSHDLRTVRWAAMTVALVVAVGILAMTVGLLRSEGARDLRILSATGASRTIRRGLIATTAGGLAALGAVLGLLGAYLGLMAFHVDDIGSLTPIPVLQLAVIVVALPVVAAGAGWLAPSREPTNLAGQPIE